MSSGNSVFDLLSTELCNTKTFDNVKMIFF